MLEESAQDEDNSVPTDGWYLMLYVMVLQAQRDLTLPCAFTKGSYRFPSLHDKHTAREFLTLMHDTFKERAKA
jgi:hypothetical protein